MSNAKRNAATRPDEDNPEWTAQDFADARPALGVVAEVFGAKEAGVLKRGRGRPPSPGRKVNQTLRLDPDVLEAYRTQGSGWQARINDVLRQHMPAPSASHQISLKRPKLTGSGA